MRQLPVRHSVLRRPGRNYLCYPLPRNSLRTGPQPEYQKVVHTVALYEIMLADK